MLRRGPAGASTCLPASRDQDLRSTVNLKDEFSVLSAPGAPHPAGGSSGRRVDGPQNWGANRQNTPHRFDDGAAPDTRGCGGVRALRRRQVVSSASSARCALGWGQGVAHFPQGRRWLDGREIGAQVSALVAHLSALGGAQVLQAHLPVVAVVADLQRQERLDPRCGCWSHRRRHGGTAGDVVRDGGRYAATTFRRCPRPCCVPLTA